MYRLYFLQHRVHSFIVSVITKLKVSKHHLTVAKLKKKSSIQRRWGTGVSDQQNGLIYSTYSSVFVAVGLLGYTYNKGSSLGQLNSHFNFLLGLILLN